MILSKELISALKCIDERNEMQPLGFFDKSVFSPRMTTGKNQKGTVNLEKKSYLKDSRLTSERETEEQRLHVLVGR